MRRKKTYHKKVFALILAIAMVFGTTGAAWAGEAAVPQEAEAQGVAWGEEATDEPLVEKTSEERYLEAVTEEASGAGEELIIPAAPVEEMPQSEGSGALASPLEELKERLGIGAAPEYAGAALQTEAEELEATGSGNLARPVVFSYSTISMNVSSDFLPDDFYLTNERKAVSPNYVVNYVSGDKVFTLSENFDYTVSYAQNTRPGYGYVCITPSSDKAVATGDEIYDLFRVRYKVDKGKVEVNTVSGGSQYITISNNDVNGYDLVAVVVEKSAEESLKNSGEVLEGVRIPANTGKPTKIYNCYDAEGDRKSFTPSANYVIYVGPGWFDGQPYIRIGYEDKEYYIDDDIRYGEFTASSVKPAPPAGFTDGFASDRKLKAVTKANQNVAVSWKKKPGAKYRLYALEKADAEAGLSQSGWHLIWPKKSTGGVSDGDEAKGPVAGTGATFTYTKDINILNYVRNGLVMLAEYEGGSTDFASAAKYLVPVSPVIFYVEGGESELKQEICFSSLNEQGVLSYKLQAAPKKVSEFKEDDADWNTIVPSEGIEDVDFAVNAKITAMAQRADFESKKALEMGAVHYFRVRSVYNFNGLILTSPPVNEKKAKAGPAKTRIYSMTGIDPKTMAELLVMGQVTGTPKTIHSRDEGEDPDESTCWKKGYVTISSPMVLDTTTVNRVELLRCDKQYGNYKVVAKYPVSILNKTNRDGSEKAKGLYAMPFSSLSGNAKDEYEKNKDKWNKCYYLTFNNFETGYMDSRKNPPVQKGGWYYAVRIVSKAGSAPGGFFDGEYNLTRREEVSNAMYGDYGDGRIELFWHHDDCVKSYWIYRAQGTTSEDAVQSLKNFLADGKGVGNSSSGWVLQKKSASSFKKENLGGSQGIYKYHLFTDRKSLELGKYYCYAIRPVYNASAEKLEKYEENTEFWRTTIRMDNAVMLSAENLHIKTVKVENYSAKGLTVKWTAAPKSKSTKKNKATSYKIFRCDSGDTTKAENYKEIRTVDQGTADFKRLAIDDLGLEIGKSYSYYVKPYYGEAEGGADQMFLNKSPANNTTRPLKVVDLKATKRNTYQGAMVRWGINSKDQPYFNSGELTCQISTDKGSSWFAPNSNTSYTDNNSLSRGNRRTYYVQVVAKSNGTASKSASVAYSLPSRLTTDKDDFTVKAGETATIKVYFKDNTGSDATVRELDGKPTSSDSKVVEVTGYENKDNYVAVKVKGIKSSYGGRISIKIKGWGGSPEKTVHVKVEQASSSYWSGSSSMR